MSKINIAQFNEVSATSRGSLLCAETPQVKSEDFTTSGSSAQSTAFDSQTRFIRVISDVNVRISIGGNPTALATDIAIRADSPEYFGVSAGSKIAFIEG